MMMTAGMQAGIGHKRHVQFLGREYCGCAFMKIECVNSSLCALGGIFLWTEASTFL